MKKSRKIELVTKEPPPEDLQEYITWILTQDAGNNPVDDLTGERAARNQGRYHVWFIPGTTTDENKITRTCAVPSNTHILILAATSDSSYLEHEGAQDDGHLLAIAKEIAKLHKDVEITITDNEGNGETFGVKDANNPQEGELKLIETPAFPIIIAENNIYKKLYRVRGGYTHLAIVAWGIRVKLLEPGKYRLIMKAHHDGTPKDQPLEVKNLKVPVPRFNLDIEYELIAIAEKAAIVEKEKPIPSFAKYPE